MVTYRSDVPEDVSETVLTVGTFDGVHRGHRLILDRVAARARAANRRSALITFDPHPLEVVNPSAAPHLLTVGDEKAEFLSATGVDFVVVVPFTAELASYDAEKFVDVVLLGRFRMQELLIGHDHGFGRGRAGDAAVLQSLGRQRGFSVEVVPPVEGRDGRPVSSTGIRRAIASGTLAAAADGLGRPYSAAGTVVAGAGRGRALGFRTLNLSLASPRKLLPPQGVYAVRAQTDSGPFGGMLNLGPRPTFGETELAIEAHLFDADGDWYGSRVRLDFVSRLRDVQKFSGPDDLIAQLKRDEEAARLLLARSRAGL